VQTETRVQFPPLPRLFINVPVFAYHFQAVTSVPPRSRRYIRRIAILATACSQAPLSLRSAARTALRASFRPLAQVAARRVSRPLLVPRDVHAARSSARCRCVASLPPWMVFARIHPQELNHGGVYAAKNDLSGVDCGEIAIGLPGPTREISLSSSVSSPSRGRRNGGWCLGKTATAVGHPRLDRTRRPKLPIWEQNGNRIGNISPMRLQFTCVGAVS
jgi:hypothetical protein